MSCRSFPDLFLLLTLLAFSLLLNAHSGFFSPLLTFDSFFLLSLFFSPILSLALAILGILNIHLSVRPQPVFRCVLASLYEVVSVCPSDGPSDGWMFGNPKMNGFLYENHWGGPFLTLLNVLGVLTVLNVLYMPMDASLHWPGGSCIFLKREEFSS